MFAPLLGCVTTPPFILISEHCRLSIALRNKLLGFYDLALAASQPLLPNAYYLF